MVPLAILVFVIDLMVIIHIVQSPIRPAAKAIWIMGVLLLPVLGAIAWCLAPPPRRGYAKR